MALINGSIPSLVHGVSQQPVQLRLPTQAEDQVNGWSSLSDGLTKRPPTVHVARITPVGYVKPYVHHINRDENEKYIVLFYPNAITVVGPDGTSYPVEGTDFSYLDNHQPYRQFKALTVSDTTFVLNRAVETAMNPALTTGRTTEALVWIRAGTYKCEYTIKVNSSGNTYETDATDANTIQTTNIAQELKDLIDVSLGTEDWVCTRYANTLWIRRVDGADFNITTSDDNGDQNHRLIKGEVRRFSDLPDNAPNGYIVKVKGNVEDNSDDYWVKFTTNTGAAFGPGVWSETSGPGLSYRFDESTLPHQLVRKQDADGSITGSVGGIYFEWSQVLWTRRLAGGESITPPSFIGYPISDIFLHRNRLGFLSRGNVILSQAANLTNYWRQTALTLLDDDPIDVSVDGVTEAINLRHAVPFNDELLLFSARHQLSLRSGDILSPKTVNTTISTSYTSHLDCTPVGAENMVYFAFDNGEYTGIREYFVDPSTSQKDAKTVTDHVPRFLKGSALRITSSPTTDALFVLTDSDRNIAYVYQWYWNGSEKVQSTWHRWDFGENSTIVSLGFLGEHLYAVTVYNDGTYLEKIDLAASASDVNQTFQTLLDRRITETTAVSVVYDTDADTTTITFPFLLDAGETWSVVTRGTSDGGWIPARRATVVELLSNKLVVDGDVRSGFFAGRNYSLVYQFSPAYLRTQGTLGGITTVQDGRLQILDWSVAYFNTGYFRAEVSPLYRDTAEYEMTGQVVLTTAPGAVQLPSGNFRFKVLARNDQVMIRLVNDSHLPSHFTSAEWIADYSQKSRRI